MTRQPFPSDVILQVEVYTNDSELWLKRQNKVQQIYNDVYRGSCPSNGDRKTRSLTREEFLAESCSFSGIWSWTGLPQACSLSMNMIFTGLELVDTMSKYNDFEEKVNQKQENNQIKHKRKRTSANSTKSKHSVTNICPKMDIFMKDSSRDSVAVPQYIPSKGDFGKNYTLFDLFDYYGMFITLECCYIIVLLLPK